MEVEFPFDKKETFDKYSKNDTLPKNDFVKQAVLLILLDDFEDDRKYAETEVNDIIKLHFSDFSTVRRELINYGYLQRDVDTMEYWVQKRVLTTEFIRENTILRRHAQPYKVLDEDKG